MVNAKFPCSICQKNVVTDAVECELCYKWVHRRCAKLTKQQLRVLENDHFTCLPCKNLFPFQNIDDDEIQAELFHTYTQNNTTRYKQCKSFEEAVDSACNSLERMLVKRKEKMRAQTL